MKYIKILLNLIIIFNSLISKELRGIIINQDDIPIDYAVIVDNGSKEWTIADENGEFSINSSGETITITRIGYKPKTFMPIGSFQYFKLLSESIELDPVNVFTVNDIRMVKEFKEKSLIGEFSNYGNLYQIPSFSIRTYGSISGVVSPSFDNGFPRHTKVLFNNVDVTNAQLGQADLSLFPTQVLNNVAFDSNIGAVYNSGSIDGVINFKNQNSENSVFINSGSNAFSQFGSKISLSRESSRRDIFFSKTQYDGNYKFYNNISNQYEKRENNQFDQVFFSINRIYKLNNDTFFHYSSMFSIVERNVPGSVFYPTSNASRKDDISLRNLTWTKNFNSSSLKFYFHIVDSIQEYQYDSEQSSLSEHLSNTYTSGINFKTSNRQRNFQIIFENKKNFLDSNDIGKINITEKSLLTSFQYNSLNNRFRTKPVFRFDSQENIQKNTFSLSSSYKFKLLPINFEIETGSGFQFPSLNDLYWPDSQYSSGNKNLKNEESNYLTSNLTYNNSSTLFKASVSFKKYKDLINWISDQNGKYSPVNISIAEKNSLNLFWKLSNDNQGIISSINFYDSIDKSKNKKLLYVPDYQASLTYFFSIDKHSLEIDYLIIGDRITQYASSYTPEVLSKKFDTINLAYALKEKSIRYGFIINNLFNEKYQSTFGYPEPLRTFNLTLEYFF
jgi:outer membrane cobalamin receptor